MKIQGDYKNVALKLYFEKTGGFYLMDRRLSCCDLIKKNLFIIRKY
jgi:hypothetical protein